MSRGNSPCLHVVLRNRGGQMRVGILRGLLAQDVGFGKKAHRAVATYVLFADSGVDKPDRVADFHRRTRGFLITKDVNDLRLVLVVKSSIPRLVTEVVFVHELLRGLAAPVPRRVEPLNGRLLCSFSVIFKFATLNKYTSRSPFFGL